MPPEGAGMASRPAAATILGSLAHSDAADLPAPVAGPGHAWQRLRQLQSRGVTLSPRRLETLVESGGVCNTPTRLRPAAADRREASVSAESLPSTPMGALATSPPAHRRLPPSPLSAAAGRRRVAGAAVVASPGCSPAAKKGRLGGGSPRAALRGCCLVCVCVFGVRVWWWWWRWWWCGHPVTRVLRRVAGGP